MKVKVKSVFFDDKGLHKKGEIVEVKTFMADRMELVKEEVKTEKKAKAKKG